MGASAGHTAPSVAKPRIWVTSQIAGVAAEAINHSALPVTTLLVEHIANGAANQIRLR